ncbi:MAG: hypothetical protein FWG47_07385 [Propionibacteriaceae bacterium]|nr:hypothetical protein [Propionibacteriaceae bacterium]
MSVLSPAGVADLDPGLKAAPRVDSLDPASLQVAFLGNAKPNIDHVFAGTQEKLQERGFLNFRSFAKATPARPAPDDIIDEIVKTCSLAVVGSCD